MRHLMILIFLVIFCSLKLTTSAPIALENTKCCLEFNNARIPLTRVKSYYWTSDTCPKRAIVFQTDKKEICVDPETTWVNSHTAKVDNRTSTTTAKTQTSTKL